MINKFLKNGHKIILFDGVCNFCNSSVLKIIKHDKKNIFLFASIQSDIGFLIMNHFKIDSSKTDSIILVESEDKFHVKSTAALKILEEFNGLWRVLQICWIIPLFIRNSAYNYIAKNRYKWFGKKNKCVLPSNDIKSKFI
jgi:predicted DCC family thiol-disulfide oxidoreductase YuxK